jgi:hypothetical protein
MGKLTSIYIYIYTHTHNQFFFLEKDVYDRTDLASCKKRPNSITSRLKSIVEKINFLM